jgi:hypothetical protein
MSHKYVTKVAILLLAACFLLLADPETSSQEPEASSKKPKIKPGFVNYLRDTILEVVSKPLLRRYKDGKPKSEFLRN